MSFKIKRNDRLPAYEVLLDTGSSLVGATVLFFMTKRGGTTPKVNGGACTIVDAATGRVRYEWAVGDTDTAGTYDAEFEITYANGKKQTLPDEDYLEVTVSKDLG